MADDTSDEIQKRIEALPPEIKGLIYSSQMDTAMQQIGAKNQLHIDQIGALESEVVAAMIGISALEDLPSNLMDTLGIDKMKSDALVKDINEQLLNKIRNSMKQADTKQVEAAPIPTNPPAISSTFVPVVNKTEEKSVVMPSAVKAAEVAAAPVDIAPAPATTTPTPVEPAMPTVPAMQTVPSVPEIIKPAGLPMVPHVDAMFDAPTVSIAPKPMDAASTSAPATPTNTAAPATIDIKKSDAPAPPPLYKTDPYHEPID